ncbi:Imidazolonepropionase [Nitrincola lacisaponensis]|uniref:Imidazolonepropionase n=1 Tax=Nitrincola lacisaponensis TaxID=267850 RepID=A0A063Y4U6_9GAMM|nr:imidazolonepropionase [Nitrincola lacisaponensis]KDE41348.1 Imidazolonepropionase [Nitrincola lacisaponensis]
MADNHNNLSLWRDATLFDGERLLEGLYAVVTRDTRIDSIYPMASLPADIENHARLIHQGGVITPGLIDCHTHLVFAGSRADEFEQRLEGASYAEIARQGGGILSTVRATRQASEQTLYEASLPRIQALIQDGVTCVEIKSGYGLTLADELKMLRVARRIGRELPVRVTTTLLAAHALPPEYAQDADGYIDLICREIIPAAATEQLADAVDVFCEGIGFSVAQCERVFQAAQAAGIPVKAHAEQLSNLGGSALAARYQALSADHIEWLDEAGIQAMAAAGTVATLLPGAFYTLRDTQVPPIELLRQYQVPMALATDANPGTSPIFQLSLMLNMACTLFRLTPTEALQGVTRHAAKALGMADQIGLLAPGYAADFCVWDIHSPAELAYAIQPGRLKQRVFNGEVSQ